jgi:hypothetical protein
MAMLGPDKGEFLKRQREDEILAASTELDPQDTSLRANGIRETAGMLQDHREAEAIRTEIKVDELRKQGL